MTNKNVKAALVLVLTTASASALAQVAYVRPAYQFPSAPPQSGPASVQMGDTPVYLSPYLGAALGHDDNLFLSHTNEKASNFYAVSPGFTLDARDANKVFQASYNAQIGRYTSSSADDYIDQTARAQLDMALDRRNFLHLGLEYLRGHDPRGSTDRPIQNQPDRYRQQTPSATYALGAPGAQGRVELYYDDPHRVYLNNRDVTSVSDRNTQEFGGAFYWRVMPKTYVMAEARETNIRYDQPSAFSADEYRYYAGVTWEATAATSGTIKVGQLHRDFKSDLEPDFTGSSWEGMITWAPRTYSKFDFYTTRQTNESTGLGSFILTSIAGVSWTHNWNSQVTTGVDARYVKDDYQGFDRNDRTAILGLKAGYKFRRWLTLGAEYTYWKRDSNIDTFDYNRNLFLITATASM
jgi:hypothetical protein